jgi:hypothetical protein
MMTNLPSNAEITRFDGIYEAIDTVGFADFPITCVVSPLVQRKLKNTLPFQNVNIFKR